MIGMQLGCGLFASATSAGIGAAETDFPIGSVATLVDPFKDYTGQEVVSTFTKMPNGNWSSGSMHNEYFTSFEKLNFKRPVRIVMYGGLEIWPNDKRAQLSRAPEIADVVIPPSQPVMLPDVEPVTQNVAPWTPPAPAYDAPRAPVPQRVTAPAPVPEKSNTGMWALLAGLAFVFLR